MTAKSLEPIPAFVLSIWLPPSDENNSYSQVNNWGPQERNLLKF